MPQTMLSFIDRSPSVFHVIDGFSRRLLAQGYTRLCEAQRWELQPGGRYFVTRNGSSLLAFRIPVGEFTGYMMAAAHSDSPAFKLKENPELPGAHCVRLNTEKYGGMLMSTWFDRPLSVAGRLLVRQDGRIVTKLVDLERELAIIPSVAIHMNRNANDGVKLLANVDTLPLLGEAASAGSLLRLAAETAGVREEDILGHDLFLYLRQKGTVLGANGEYIAGPRLDDLECAYCCMEGFLQAKQAESLPLCAIFDNEEVGSGTKQGALSTFLPDTLQRINDGLGRSREEHLRTIAGSFLLSADNAHAMHPNHPEYSDAVNCPRLNGGVVLKFNANQKYTTDAVSAAIFRQLCGDAGVPVQTYANRSDLPGGSTLGNLANTQISLNTADIGLAQLAMHSAYETAGAKDPAYLIRALTEFFGRSLRDQGDGCYILK